MMITIVFKIICLAYGLYSLYVICKPRLLPYYLGITFMLDAITHAYGVYSTVLSFDKITLYVSDMPIVVMIVILLLTKTKLKKTWVTAFWMAMFVMIVYSAVMGLVTYGINNYYLSDIRVFLSMSIPIIYFYLRPLEVSYKTVRFFSRIISLVVGYCYFVWILYLLTGINLCSSEAGGGLRVWGSTYAFIIAVWVICNIYMEIVLDQRKRLSWKSIMLIAAVVILQHNSVWAALVVGIVALVIFYLLAREKSEYKRVNQKGILMQVFLVLASMLVFLVVFKNSFFVQTLLSTTDKYIQIVTGTGTIGGRQEIWANYLATLSKGEWIIGKPMGKGWVVLFGGVESINSPHNAYVQGVMRIGLLGTGCLFGMLVFVMIKAIQEKKELAAAVLIASFVYLYAYMFSLEMSCVWGIIIGLVCNNRKKGIYNIDGIIDGEQKHVRSEVYE